MSFHILPSFRRFLAVAVAGVSVTLFAGSAAHYQGPDWALLDATAELKAAAVITPAQYPDCDVVTVDQRTAEEYQPDGSGESQNETYAKVLTEKGRNDSNVLQLWIMLPYFTVDVPTLEIIKPDGQVVPVDVAANAKESIDNSQMDENIYDPNSRILRVNIPGLQVGDVVHSVARTTVVRPIIPGAFSDEFLFEGTAYIRHASCQIRAPAEAPLRHLALRHPVDGTVKYTTHPADGNTVLYDWEVNGVRRMYEEPSMPPPETVLQHLVVSTLPDWPAASRWYWQVSQAHLAATSPEMGAVVRKLTAGASTDLQKITAVFYYVSKNIRYMGVTPETDRPGFEPHDVKLTFAKKYGVCRDKAALLVAMLRMAGQQAYPVLINVGTKLDPEVPTPDFNHAVVAVETSAGHYLLMDPTDEHTRKLLPAYDDDQSYLVCRPEGDVLRISPVTPPDENLLQIATSGVLGPDGGLTATSDISFAGVNDDTYRGAFAEMKPDDQRRFFETRLQQSIPGARLTALRLSPESMLDESAPLHVVLSYSAAANAAFGGRRAVVEVPWIGRNLGVVNFILDGTGLAQRKYPLETQVACGIEEKISLRLPEDFTRAVSLPASSTEDDDSVDYQRHFGIDGRTFQASKRLALKVVEFSPAQYLDLKKALKNLQYDERKAPVMATSELPPAPRAVPSATPAPPPVESNAEVLTDDQKLTVTDAHSGVLRVHYVKRILSYAGKIRESEVKIPYNPATEKVTLLHATVVSATGQRQEGSPDEINQMDADWNASAKRYTGGKIFVDSLPGVEIGSTIDVEYEIAMREEPFLSGFQAFQLPDKVDRKSFVIEAPAALPISEWQSGPAGVVTRSERTVDGKEIREWQAQQVGAVPVEPNAPPPWLSQAGVAYTFGDPAAYLRELNRTLLGRAAKSAHAGTIARRLAGAAKGPEETVRAIRDYVARNVRAAGPGFTDLPLDELSDADTTLSEGYGHQADRAILYHAMLAAAGLHPEFVLASGLPAIGPVSRVAKTSALLDAFADPLVKVTIGGAVYYLNDTDQYAPLGATLHDDRLAIALDSGSLETIAAAKGDRTRVATHYTVSLDQAGNATIGIREEYYGMNYAEMNRHLAEMRPEERAHYYEETVSGVAQGARPAGELETDFTGYPGVEQFAVTVDRYGVADHGYLYLNLPFTPRLLATGAAQRAQALYIESESDDTIAAEVKLPPTYHDLVISPKTASLTFPEDSGSVRIESANEGNVYHVTYRLQRHPALISPPDYPAARAAESTLENRASRVLLLENGTSGAQS